MRRSHLYDYEELINFSKLMAKMSQAMVYIIKIGIKALSSIFESMYN